MKRRILLLMMTALLSVGAWADTLWTGEFSTDWNSNSIGVDFPTDLTKNDVIRLTVHIENGWGWSISLFEDNGNGWHEDDAFLSVICANWENGNDTNDGGDRVIEIPITDDIITKINTNSKLWIGGNQYSMTSVDIARNGGLNLLQNSTDLMGWGTSIKYDRLLSYASVGDLIVVEAERLSGDWGEKVSLTSNVNPDDGTTFATGSLGDYGAGRVTLSFTLTSDMLESSGLSICGGWFTLYSVKLKFSPRLANDADNTDAIDYWKNISTNVTLAGRTLTKSGDWNTLCLPFAVSKEQLEESTNPLYGATIMELASSSNLAANGTLTLNFTDALSIEAGKPYIVKWTGTSGSVENPLFEGVTITATTPTDVEFTNNAGGSACKFVGQFSPFTIDDGNIDEIIMLGSGSKLGYSQDARTLKTFRAHFEVPTTSGGSHARGFVMNFGGEETTGIISVQGSGSMVNGSDAWYSLGGQRLQGAPTAKGVYIQNGRKVVVK